VIKILRSVRGNFFTLKGLYITCITIFSCVCVFVGLSSPIYEVKYEFINLSFKRSHIARYIKELDVKIQQQISQ
jgi:hypothetical protein